jgi:hypothetical protein
MIKTMKAKYRGKDARTGVAIYPGDEIQYCTTTRRTWITGEPSDGQINTITLNDQGVYRTFTRNPRGRCEDYPCCGCCTI